MIQLKKEDHVLYELFAMIRQTYPENKYGDQHAVEEYIATLRNQEQDIKKLRKRTITAGEAFKGGSPVYRVVAGLVKEKDGNLVPLIMLAGYHPDAEPEKGKYKMKLVDVTFDAPKPGDMIYVGDTVEASDKASGERDGIASAFHNFAGSHHYGKGRIIYRVPGTDFQGNLDSYTKWTDYLKMAVAALGLVLLIAGVVASGGLLSPAAAAVVSALGVAVGVAGAYLSIRNIQERREKGTFEWDAETSLDIINIIAGVFLAAGTAIKLTQVISRSVNLLMTIEKARGLVLIYDAVNIGANVWLINEKVKEDANAIRAMHLPKAEEEELLAQVNLEAIQQGAMMAVSAYSMGRGVFEHFKAKTAGVSWHTWEARGWIKKVGGKTIITDEAPPFIRAKMKLIGTAKDTDSDPTGSGKKPPGTGTDPKPDVRPAPKNFEESLPTTLAAARQEAAAAGSLPPEDETGQCPRRNDPPGHAQYRRPVSQPERRAGRLQSIPQSGPDGTWQTQVRQPHGRTCHSGQLQGGRVPDEKKGQQSGYKCHHGRPELCRRRQPAGKISGR
ncbi:hypothetical protein ACQ86N_04095 [Puia sp. P3]|uniref:hypothetical protein n=1 Tax=Puia sp. P3 TaxID=3423952 RepID=UPI003D67D069